MCCFDGETVDHLLLHCAFVQVLWNFVFGFWDPVGFTATSGRFIIWMEKLVWEAPIQHLELSSAVLDVVGLV
jgi:hypothetical protein